MEKTMKARKILESDSIEQLARFRDTHDLTDFEHLLKVVPKKSLRANPKL
jgi:hypothetical protein